jgi:hypothetical protein
MKKAPHYLDVCRDIVRHPFKTVVLRWNWKSALLSPLARGILILAANASGGSEAATNALSVEIVYRAATSGFAGSIGQTFRSVEPYWAGQLTALAIPVACDLVGWLIHWSNGTPAMAGSIAVSLIVTMWSTTFDYFAMRRGVLIVGDQRKSLIEDLSMLPMLILDFITTIYGKTRFLLFGRAEAS